MRMNTKGKPESIKRKLSDAEESEEEAAEKKVSKKHKPRRAEKSPSQSPVGDDSDGDEEKKASTKQSNSGSLPSASTDDDRRDERDRRTLFLKNLPGNCTVRHIKALSKDIKQVRLRSALVKAEDKKKRIAYAYVSFASEEAAEKNFKLLDGKVFNGTTVSVDYVGSKSQFQSAKIKTEPEKIDPLRLYLSGLPGNATEADIKKLFPGAVDIVLPKRHKDKLLFGYGFVGFKDPALASKYHDQGQDLVLNGKKLVVLYAKQRKSERKSEKKKSKQTKKGTKGAVKQEVVEQDDDEDDDDEDDDDDMEDDE